MAIFQRPQLFLNCVNKNTNCDETLSYIIKPQHTQHTTTHDMTFKIHGNIYDSLLILTDLEPDDILALYILFNKINKIKNDVPMLIIVGDAMTHK